MPFSSKTLEFLFENHARDSKEWFNEHRQDYEKYVKEPFKEFVLAIEPTMEKIDEKISCDPKRLSRIYRDARYSKGQSIFRNYTWYTFSRTREEATTAPCFYFGISPNGFEYGCGYYHASTASMNAMRKLILEGDPGFEAANTAYLSQNVFALGGERYKKDHYPEESEEKRLWLNQRNIFLGCDSNNFKAMYSKNLYKKVAKDFLSIAPVYNMLMKAEQIK
ncbi:MAG: DUF2461 domain-containing protein, partial [Ruminiclostridium sp.]|nr:DUF2461 domain-containing protein [Ruminiclostridium sp.]